MAKIDWKKHIINRLKIVAFIFALVGWFLIITVVLEDFIHQDLSGLESFMQTNQVKWGINIFVIGLFVVLIKRQGWVDEKLNDNKLLRTTLKIVLFVGFLGWIIGLGSLFLK
jgi:hypothetical protein